MTGTSPHNLAFCYQEILTMCARLRKSKISDSAYFRTSIRNSLQEAENAARALGYQLEDIRLASYAVIALLDEVILNSSLPAFREWARQPLMLELYRTGDAGDGFFENLRMILNRPENKFAIDLMEVYALCLLLGFRGRYSSTNDEQIYRWRDPLIDKIRRLRSNSTDVMLSENWLPEAALELPPPSNRLTRMALSATLGIFAVCVLAFGLYTLLLSKDVADVTALAQY